MAVTRVDEFVLGQVLPHKSISVAPELKMTLIDHIYIHAELVDQSSVKAFAFMGYD